MCTIDLMRALLATSIGVAAAGALLLSFAPTESADSKLQLSGRHAAPAAPAADTAGSTDSAHTADTADTAHHRAPRLPGHTQSLPLGKPTDRSRSGGRSLTAWQDDPSGGRTITTRNVEGFSLMGVVWDDAQARPRVRLQVQTRDARTGRWTGWRSLSTHDDDRPDPGGQAHAHSAGRGSTAPVWTGDSNAVRVRVQTPAGHGGAASPQLPAGARLELVDPGRGEPGPDRTGRQQKQQQNEQQNEQQNKQKQNKQKQQQKPEDRPGGVLPALDKSETQTRYGEGEAADQHIGPRPAIVTRKGWGADESLRQGDNPQTDSVQAAFIHHSAESNDYDCSQSSDIIRGIYRYHVLSSKWRDIGYNFLVDKCGKIYEGRAGGVAEPVTGAHTFGFNKNTTGIAVLGTYSETRPPKAVTDALAKLTAWKLGVHGVNANGRVTLVSGGGNKYDKGTRASFDTVSGHRDGYDTDCPGDALYGQLGAIRTDAGRLQGR